MIDAAIAVNEAPTLAEAFQILADAGLALLGCDRIAVTVWDDSGSHGTVVAGAGAAAGVVGSIVDGNEAIAHALATNEPVTKRLGLVPVGSDAVASIAVPIVTASSNAMFHAGWQSQLEPVEIANATRLLQTMTRLTSIAERSLRERDHTQLESVLEGVADGVIVTQGTQVTANAAARAMLGLGDGVEFELGMFKPRTLTGEPYEHRPGYRPGENAMETGSGGRFRVRATALDGRELVLDGSVSPVPGGAVTVFRDVTDEHAEKVLNERYLYALFNSLPIALTVGSARDRSFMSANQAFLDLTGFERDEIIGVTPPFPWWDAGEDETAGFEPGSVIHRIYRRKDGRPLAVEVASHGIPGDDGETELLLGVITDVTEKRRLDQQLVQSGKLAAIGELAAGVAHEINNPLFAILGLTEFLLKEAEPGSKPYQRLELIQQTGLEIKEIVRALLDFARENAEERQVVPLEEVVKQTVDLVRRTNAHKGIELVDHYDDSSAIVTASPNQLKQIFLNLIANARQAMPGGGTVHVEVRREGENVLAIVTDDGPGIEPNVIDRIFEPFFTTKRATGGTGLGLSVSLGIAESHGGSLTVSSEPGDGAAFTLCLPIMAEDVSE